MKLDYDGHSDVLYITFAESKAAARYVELAEGIVVRLNKRSGKVLSCTIAMFAKRSALGQTSIPELTEIGISDALRNAGFRTGDAAA